MNLTVKLCSVGLVTMLALGACGDDSKDNGPHTGLDDAGDPGTTGKSMDGGVVTKLDSGTVVTRPTTDGSILSDASILEPSDASVTGEIPTDGALPVSLVPLAEDGTKLSACYNDADCNKGLTCVNASGNFGAGFCNDTCKADKDCAAIDGVAGACSIYGQCVLDCSDMFAGDGPCPTNMVCRNINVPGALALPTFQCSFPLGAGSKSVAAYGKCDLNHGGGDCVGVQSCHVPVGDLVTVVTAPVGPGYCAPGCAAMTDCQVPSGTSAAPVCNFGECELDCSGAGATCPAGMNCLDVDDAPLLTTLRCRYIN